MSEGDSVVKHAVDSDLLNATKALLVAFKGFLTFCNDPNRPCNEHGSECPIAMGEWEDASDLKAVHDAELAIAKAEIIRV